MPYIILEINSHDESLILSSGSGLRRYNPLIALQVIAISYRSLFPGMASYHATPSIRTPILAYRANICHLQCSATMLACKANKRVTSLLHQGLVHTRVWRRKYSALFQDYLLLSAVLRVRGRFKTRAQTRQRAEYCFESTVSEKRTH